MPAVAHPVRDHCLAPDRSIDAPIAPVGGSYGRAFPDLPALEGDQAALLALGAPGGMCDGSDATGDDGVDAAECFDAARRATMWHYQWVIVEDFLPALVDPALVEEVKDPARRCYRPEGTPIIPFEFADAAFRYGHGQIRHRYRLQPGGAEYSVFPDLVGFAPVAPEHRIDWRLLFGPEAQPTKRMDGRLTASLIGLPLAITGDVDVDAYHSLAARDLQRGAAIGLPSGEAVARAIGVAPLTREEAGLGAFDWEGETPLWLYVLREADVRGAGERLGELGGRLVAEVLLGLLDLDPESYRALDPGWQPTLPAAGERFTVLDLLVGAS